MGQCPAVGSRQHSLALLVPLTQKALVSSESFSPQPPGALEGQAHALGEGNDYVSVLSRFSRVQLLATLWTVARQAPLSMGFLLRCAGKAGNPSRQRRGIDSPVAIRRGEGA